MIEISDVSPKLQVKEKGFQITSTIVSQWYSRLNKSLFMLAHLSDTNIDPSGGLKSLRTVFNMIFHYYNIVTGSACNNMTEIIIDNGKAYPIHLNS